MLDLWGSFSTDLGVDLGTDHTRICLRDEGIVLDEPTAAAVDLRQGKILALGREARQMLGRTPEGIQVVRPLQNGVIADFDLTRRMLKGFLRQALGKRPLFRPRLVLSVPCGVNSVERRAVLDAAMEAGAGEAYLLEAPLAAALGAGIPVRETKSCLVVDMGAGATEAAVLTQGKIAVSRLLRQGGRSLDEALVQYSRKKYNLLIGSLQAEQVKIEIGTVRDTVPPAYMDLRGRELITGLPRSVAIDRDQLQEALWEPVHRMVDCVRNLLEQLPDLLARDVAERGIVLTGGGALLRNFDWLLERETGLRVWVAENALTCGVKGTGSAAGNMKEVRKGPRPRRNV